MWSVKRPKDKTLESGGEEEEEEYDQACYCALETDRNVDSNLRNKVHLISY
jgi:hypothetical protein